MGKNTCHASVKNWVQIPRTHINPDDTACVNNPIITPVRKWGKTGEPPEVQESANLRTAADSRDLLQQGGKQPDTSEAVL